MRSFEAQVDLGEKLGERNWVSCIVLGTMPARHPGADADWVVFVVTDHEHPSHGQLNYCPIHKIKLSNAQVAHLLYEVKHAKR